MSSHERSHITRLPGFEGLISVSRVLLRSGVGVALALGLSACGPPKVYKGPTPEQAAAKTAAPKPADLSLRGRPADLGATIELVGYETVWLKGTRVLVTLSKTEWDEIAGDREGRAELVIDTEGIKQKVTLDEAETRTIDGLTYRVDHADELYIEDKGTWEPHCKLVVTR